jgi:hypothetical protein
MKEKNKQKSKKITSNTFGKKYIGILKNKGIPPTMEIWQTLTAKESKSLDKIPEKKKEITNI